MPRLAPVIATTLPCMPQTFPAVSKTLIPQRHDEVKPLTRWRATGMLEQIEFREVGVKMKHWMLAGTTAALALVAANSALADVTPEEVWQNWQDFYTSSGSTVTTGSVERDGDTLIITDFKTSSDNETGTSDSAVAEIRLRDNGDGSVGVEMSEDMTFGFTTLALEGEGSSGATGTAKMPGLTGTVSGSVDDMAYDYTMPSVEITMEPIENGAPAGKISVLLSDSTSTYQLSGPAEAKVLDGSFGAASMAVNLEITDPESPFVGSLNVADLAGQVSGSVSGIEEVELTDAFAKGFALDMGMTYGAMVYDFDVSNATTPGALMGGSEGGSFQFALDAAKMLLAGGGKNVSATLSSADLPFPEVKVSYAESGFNLTLPLTKGDAPQDFSFLTKVVDLQISEEIWAMLDPTGALPHDPATLVIDTTGTALLKADLMASAEGATPDAELHSLNVNDLTARIAGAELTGTGAFTFDNTDLTTFEGMPAPTGKMELKLVGGNGLLDALVAMGMLSEDDAMGARMMIAMFANPGAGEDELTSVLEFKDKGFFANGQQLQ
jgi:hypothetical protein